MAPLAHGCGESLLFFDPQRLDLPAGEMAATLELQQAFTQVVAQVDPQQPWRTADAQRLDRLSVAQWTAERSNHKLARLPLEWLCRVGGSGGFEPWEASILHLARSQAVAPQAESPEAWLVRGGAGQVPPLLVEAYRPAILIVCTWGSRLWRSAKTGRVSPLSALAAPTTRPGQRSWWCHHSCACPST